MQIPEVIQAEPERAVPQRSRSREESSPHQLFNDHFEAIYRFFSRRVGSPEDAQDLAAETFAAVVQRPCPRNVEPLCWLYGIARRKLANSLRQSKRRAMPPPTQSQPEESGELRRLIDSLPDPQREALLLQALEDLSVAQIAQVMGRSSGSVKALLQRAKERIRKDSRGTFDPEVQS